MAEGIINITEPNFDSVVAKSDKPVLVDFWAPWCGPCRSIAPILEDMAKELGDQAVIAKVNIDDNRGLADRFSIRAIPTILFFKDGQVKDQVVGLANKEALVAKIKAL
ncbi:MAG: thioredoxin [Verrucomicrobia bacterium]|nr:thioredoxin [Verrucomicrobiota bacterium]